MNSNINNHSKSSIHQDTSISQETNNEMNNKRDNHIQQEKQQQLHSQPIPANQIVCSLLNSQLNFQSSLVNQASLASTHSVLVPSPVSSRTHSINNLIHSSESQEEKVEDKPTSSHSNPMGFTSYRDSNSYQREDDGDGEDTDEETAPEFISTFYSKYEKIAPVLNHSSSANVDNYPTSNLSTSVITPSSNLAIGSIMLPPLVPSTGHHLLSFPSTLSHPNHSSNNNNNNILNDNNTFNNHNNHEYTTMKLSVTISPRRNRSFSDFGQDGSPIDIHTFHRNAQSMSSRTRLPSVAEITSSIQSSVNSEDAPMIIESHARGRSMSFSLPSSTTSSAPSAATAPFPRQLRRVARLLQKEYHLVDPDIENERKAVAYMKELDQGLQSQHPEESEDSAIIPRPEVEIVTVLKARAIPKSNIKDPAFYHSQSSKLNPENQFLARQNRDYLSSPSLSPVRTSPHDAFPDRITKRKLSQEDETALPIQVKRQHRTTSSPSFPAPHLTRLDHRATPSPTSTGFPFSFTPHSLFAVPQNRKRSNSISSMSSVSSGVPSLPIQTNHGGNHFHPGTGNTGITPSGSAHNSPVPGAIQLSSSHALMNPPVSTMSSRVTVTTSTLQLNHAQNLMSMNAIASNSSNTVPKSPRVVVINNNSPRTPALGQRLNIQGAQGDFSKMNLSD